MALTGDEPVSSGSHSVSSDESDSQDSDTMPRPNHLTGNWRKSNSGRVKKPNDPSGIREKRKKAKRACRPCQIAHLTCSDERPCSRCVKRNCAHACRDGVRKKAKYLDGTSTEALIEAGLQGIVPTQYPNRGQGLLHTVPDQRSINAYTTQQSGLSSYPLFPSSGPRMGSLPADAPTNNTTFSNPQSPLVSQFNVGTNQQSLPMQSYTGNFQPNTPVTSVAMQDTFSDDLFAPFGINSLDSFNFDNRYGAAEFRMLGHMSSGMPDTTSSDNAVTYNPASGAAYNSNAISTACAQSPVTAQSFSYPQGQAVGQWPHDSGPDSRPQPGIYQPSGRPHESLDAALRQEDAPAFAIGSSPFPSPSSGSSPQGMMAGYEDSPTNKSLYTNINPFHQTQVHREHQFHQRSEPTAVITSATTTPSVSAQALPSRRNRNLSMIYDRVKQPHSYTQGFHGLTALIRERFSPQKTAHIAKALAAIRPSFLSCTINLNQDDLIFMEKCLQRTLLEYEDFVSAVGTPTIICRRTGEIVAVGKEFSYLTGWKKDVLLGKEPNLNINKDGNVSGPPSNGASSRGGNKSPPMADPRSDMSDDSPRKPVNIVDLLDDDSACDFFDDYAHLAFGDSRGSVTTPCKLLIYKTVYNFASDENLDDEAKSGLKRRRGANLSSRCGIRGEAGFKQLGEQDGKVDCMLCWTVKRDVFDIPMLFVMNVLPCI